MKALTSLKRRWDSSDPERAPPPLPMNPGGGSPTTKSNTSAGIAAAAKKIVEASRESAPLSSYISNVTPSTSPERSLIKGAHHKRLQSMQTGSVKDLRSYLDNNRSPDRSPERERPASSTPYTSRDARDYMSATPERATTPTPASKDPFKETPALRPSVRPRSSIYGENTPPSATMLALQTMQVPSDPLNDVTNRSGSPSTPRVSNNYDFSSQLLNLTTIATNLQKEMANLSRRSKDNATDLIGLKEATSSRDEDIRKSLRELATSVTTQALLGPPPAVGSQSRSTSSYGANFLDSRAFNSPPSATKTYSIPRAASAHSFMEDVRVGSPSPYSVEGAASVAMLEKIIREMVTKEGQERLLGTLNELFDKSSKENVEAARKVEQLAQFIKEKSESQALVPVVRDVHGGPPKLELNFDSPRSLDKVREAAANAGAKPAQEEEMFKLLQRIKDSIVATGGTTAEVKGLTRDLRGEVLGMGRDLGRKLDQISEAQLNSTLDRSIEDGEGKQNLDEIHRIVEEGLSELKDHIYSMLRERQEQDDDTYKQLAVTRGGPSGEEMAAVVKHALHEHHQSSKAVEIEIERPSLDREGVLEAVKDGLKDFEPNIELQQFGLERDEILAVLREGLEEHQSTRELPATSGFDKAEVFEVMQEALKGFQPGAPVEFVQQIKDEILADVRLAVEDFKSSPAAPSLEDDAIRAIVSAAVKEGLAEQAPAMAREFEISKDDLFEAVKASLDGTTIPFNSFGEKVLTQLHELVDGMRVEFKQYSAANGRDTEQVLDAVKDGLESLRTEIESYVDRAQDVTGKDEIVDTVKGGLEQLRSDVQGYVMAGSGNDTGKADMLEYIKAEFEDLHETIKTLRDGDDEKISNAPAIVLAIKEGLEDLKSHAGRSRGIDGDDEDSREEMFEAMKEEFEQLKSAVLNANHTDKGELIETIQDSMGALHAKLDGSDLGARSVNGQEDFLHALREELASLTAGLPASAAMAGDDREIIVEGVRQALDDLRTQLSADHSDAAAEALGAIREELETFKHGMNSSVVLSGGRSSEPTDHDALTALREGLEDIKETLAKSPHSGHPVPDELVEAMRGEFENLRTSIATSVVHSSSNDDLADALRLGLDDLRSDLEKKLDSPERTQAQTSEMLDAINEGLDTLRIDLVKTIDKPLDMTVNYEILETLKDGLASLREELDILRTGKKFRSGSGAGGEMVLADANEAGETRELSPEDVAAAEAPSSGTGAAKSMKREDLGKVEVMLAQLQIKIEAMDATVQDSAAAAHRPDASTKADLEHIEHSISGLQAAITILAAKEIVMPEPVAPPAPEGIAMKEDTDALETLLRNTKGQIEDLVVAGLPLHPDTASKEHIDAIDANITVTREAVDALADKLTETTASKEDVDLVAVLAQDVKTLSEEIRDKLEAQPSEDEQATRMTKADLDVLGVICTEIKVKVQEMELPDVADMPTKADMEQLQGLIADFKESHDKMKDSYESDIAITAKAFDDRKQEFDDTVKHIEDVKMSLMELKDDVMVKFADSESGVNTLGEALKGIEERASGEELRGEVKEVLEIVKAEFEKAHGSLEAMKVDHDAHSSRNLEKQGEHKEATVLELGVKLDVLFDGLMAKFDDAQRAAEEKALALEEKTVAQEELFSKTNAMADDLKLSIDTLGTTLTGFTTSYPEAMDKVCADSKTVYNRVDDVCNKLDETQQGVAHEHGVTRDEVLRVLAAVDTVQSDLTEHNPRFMVSLKEVQALIGQHYEHSQKASETAAEHAQSVRDFHEQMRTTLDSKHAELRRDLPALLPPSAEMPAPIIAEKYDDSAMHGKLDTILEQGGKYDDSAVQDKLDTLMGHVTQTADPSAQLERLDNIHEKVMATAAEVSAFIAMQAKQISAEHESKEKEAEEVALLLERRLVQKDQIESDITVLNEEKDSLRTAVEHLRSEREALASQKAKMQADVSSLETALQIRREELHAMDSKAEIIERRMLEGVMNQSRMLLLAKSARAAAPPAPSSPKKPKPQGRDLRVHSNASALTAHSNVSKLPEMKPNRSLALSRPGVQRTGGGNLTSSPAAERRIMSLSQISHNTPTNPSAFARSPAPSLIASPAGKGLSRSHTVKTNIANRKPSWASSKRGPSLSASGFNKENESTLSEESEGELEGTETAGAYSTFNDHGMEEFASDAGTERRTSHLSQAESRATFDDALSYSEGPTPSGLSEDRRTSYGTYDTGTGSYMTGTDLDRRTSAGSSGVGTVGVESSLTHEQSERNGSQAQEERQAEEREVLRLEAPPMMWGEGEKGVYAPPSDSGLGTDLPTATFSVDGSAAEYFRS
ncbi:hypothetical protein B0A48_14543 [Cryoendolithus antarcticus]|uniref:Uncharacterized protein n=1 Tax=Cryoendolithus antarcticus TaxID=1507870 RepID=A0A1V8SL21_9PEZI|nr:hypothetical protein B0A48_14543 [Cryoendolithus antarcticus]